MQEVLQASDAYFTWQVNRKLGISCTNVHHSQWFVAEMP